MTTLSLSQKAALDALLAKGEIDEARNFLDSVAAGAPPAGAAAAAAPAPKIVRTANQVIVDAFQRVARLLGNNPTIVEILPELEEVLTPPAPAAETK